LDHADWQWITTEYHTGVEEGTGSRSSWIVVATDLSCLRDMMMMMTPILSYKEGKIKEGANEKEKSFAFSFPFPLPSV